MVLAVFQGTSPDVCHEAVIGNATLYADQRLRVHVAYRSVDHGIACEERNVTPFHIVSLEAVDAEVTFGTSDRTISTTDPTHPRELHPNATTLDRGHRPGITERQEHLVRDQGAWEALWARHTRGLKDPGQAPEIDFSRQEVLAVFMGNVSDGCHGVEIVNDIYRSADRVIGVEHYTVDHPSCSQEIFQPFHLVETERDDGEVRFQVTETTREMDD